MFHRPPQHLVQFLGNVGAVAGGWFPFDAEEDEVLGVAGEFGR
jgi:hypothetical protein